MQNPDLLNSRFEGFVGEPEKPEINIFFSQIKAAIVEGIRIFTIADDVTISTEEYYTENGSGLYTPEVTAYLVATEALISLGFRSLYQTVMLPGIGKDFLSTVEPKHMARVLANLDYEDGKYDSGYFQHIVKKFDLNLPQANAVLGRWLLDDVANGNPNIARSYISHWVPCLRSVPNYTDSDIDHDQSLAAVLGSDEYKQALTAGIRNLLNLQGRVAWTYDRPDEQQELRELFNLIFWQSVPQRLLRNPNDMYFVNKQITRDLLLSLGKSEATLPLLKELIFAAQAIANQGDNLDQAEAALSQHQIAITFSKLEIEQLVLKHAALLDHRYFFSTARPEGLKDLFATLNRLYPSRELARLCFINLNINYFADTYEKRQAFGRSLSASIFLSSHRALGEEITLRTPEAQALIAETILESPVFGSFCVYYDVKNTEDLTELFKNDSLTAELKYWGAITRNDDSGYVVTTEEAEIIKGMLENSNLPLSFIHKAKMKSPADYAEKVYGGKNKFAEWLWEQAASIPIEVLTAEDHDAVQKFIDLLGPRGGRILISYLGNGGMNSWHSTLTSLKHTLDLLEKIKDQTVNLVEEIRNESGAIEKHLLRVTSMRFFGKVMSAAVMDDAVAEKNRGELNEYDRIIQNYLDPANLDNIGTELAAERYEEILQMTEQMKKDLEDGLVFSSWKEFRAFGENCRLLEDRDVLHQIAMLAETNPNLHSFLKKVIYDPKTYIDKRRLLEFALHPEEFFANSATHVSDDMHATRATIELTRTAYTKLTAEILRDMMVNGEIGKTLPYPPYKMTLVVSAPNTNGEIKQYKFILTLDDASDPASLTGGEHLKNCARFGDGKTIQFSVSSVMYTVRLVEDDGEAVVDHSFVYPALQINPFELDEFDIWAAENRAALVNELTAESQFVTALDNIEGAANAHMEIGNILPVLTRYFWKKYAESYPGVLSDKLYVGENFTPPGYLGINPGHQFVLPAEPWMYTDFNPNGLPGILDYKEAEAELGAAGIEILGEQVEAEDQDYLDKSFAIRTSGQIRPVTAFTAPIIAALENEIYLKSNAEEFILGEVEIFNTLRSSDLVNQHFGLPNFSKIHYADNKPNGYLIANIGTRYCDNETGEDMSDPYNYEANDLDPEQIGNYTKQDVLYLFDLAVKDQGIVSGKTAMRLVDNFFREYIDHGKKVGKFMPIISHQRSETSYKLTLSLLARDAVPSNDGKKVVNIEGELFELIDQEMENGMHKIELKHIE